MCETSKVNYKVIDTANTVYLRPQTINNYA